MIFLEAEPLYKHIVSVCLSCGRGPNIIEQVVVLAGRTGRFPKLLPGPDNKSIFENLNQEALLIGNR